jgi:histidine ammonia-lyase
VLISSASDLDAIAVLAVAQGARLELAPALLEAVREQRSAMLASLDGRAVYGVNTGMGAQSKVRLTAAGQSLHQNNLLLARAVAGPPWLAADAVRALLAVRVRNFLMGDAGVSAELVALLVKFLDAGLLPAVPASGSGSAGEIIPLAHAFGPLIGVGSVLDEDGAALDAAPALAGHGVTALDLGPKEGVALLQGIPGTTAQAILVADQVRRLAEWSQVVLALSTVAASAPQDVYLSALARGDHDLAEVHAGLQQLLAGSDPSSRSLQAPVSFRVAAATLAHLRRSVSGVELAVERALAGVTDSPAFIDGGFHATAGFHGLDLAAHLDAVSVALVHAAEVSAARTHRLLDAAVTGLPAQLAGRPGSDTGLVAVHKRAAAAVHQLRRSAVSSVIGSMETSFGQEDVQTFAWEAAANTRTAFEGAAEVLACELLTAYQATTLRRRETGPRLTAALRAVADLVPPINRDRPFGRDIEALRALMRELPAF